jgi:hypothetical protein
MTVRTRKPPTDSASAGGDEKSPAATALDTRIDELYTLPLAEFTARRNALAKTLKGEDAARVKRLEKPSLVPWTVNQLYWQERRTYDRLMASGRALRAAQIGALTGTSADLRQATADHRATLSAALATAVQLAAQAGVRVQSEPLSRMLEALSLAPDRSNTPGRFTDVLQPAGFEALAGVTPIVTPGVRSSLKAVPHPSTAAPRLPTGSARAQAKAAAAAERERREAEAAARQAAEQSLARATRRLDAARAAEARAQALVDTSRQQLERAMASLEKAQADVTRAEEEVTRADAARQAL